MTQISLTDTDLQRITQLSGPDLARLYQCVTERLRPLRALVEPNQNVVTCRLPLHVCDQIKALALTRQVTRSQVIREAVLQFVAGRA